MLWHLDQYRKAKQGIIIFKTYIGNMDRALILPTYRTFISLKTFAEISNERIFFSTKWDGKNNSSMFLHKIPRPWAESLFITMKDLCIVARTGFITADQFLKSYTLRTHIPNPEYLAYLEILKPIHRNLKNKIKKNTVLSEQVIIKVMVLSSK